MLKIGLIGFGFMGKMHFDNYERLMKEGESIQLISICDLQIEELKNSSAEGNIATERDVYDITSYKLYDDIDTMLDNEELDMVDIAIPTYLHAEIACKVLARGYHVLCEKPVAGSSADGWKMVEAAKQADRKLMIGQCLRFWPAYEYLKEAVAENRFGEVVSGSFFRGSAMPKGWYHDGSLSGGCLLDMHIHDTDIIQWVLGKPLKVSTVAKKVMPGSGYDNVSTNYIYADGKAINAQSDWRLEGDFGFEMTYRVNFEKANIVFKDNIVKVNPNDSEGYVVELSEDSGYYREIKYFIHSILEGTEITICSPESAVETLEIIEAEMRSADQLGETVELRQGSVV